MKRQMRRSWRKLERKLTGVRSFAANLVRSNSSYHHQTTVAPTFNRALSDSDGDDAVFEPAPADEPSDDEVQSSIRITIPCEYCHLQFATDRITRHQRHCRQLNRSSRTNPTISRSRPIRSEPVIASAPTPSPPRTRTPSPTEGFPIPNNLVCPITATLFCDPVVAQDGHTYERAAIAHWIRREGNSPITRQHLTIGSLNPNRLIKKIADEFRAECQQKRSLYKYRIDVDLKKSEPINSIQSKYKKEYFIEWLKQHESLNDGNTILVHLVGENVDKLAEIHSRLPVHSNIVRTFGRVQHQDQGVLLVQEYAPVQTLTQFIADDDHSLLTTLLDVIFYQIAEALKCLATAGIIHGHLTADNVLIYHLDNVIEDTVVKLTNISEYLIRERSCSVTESNKIAPEILSDQIYSEKSDVFAFGALAREVYSLQSDRQVLFEPCIAADAHARPTFHQLTTDIRQLIKEEQYMELEHSYE